MQRLRRFLPGTEVMAVPGFFASTFEVKNGMGRSE
jgi:hypothetical protein